MPLKKSKPPRRPAVLLVTGPTSAGKSFVTRRHLALDYGVLTGEIDRMYGTALREVGAPIHHPSGGYRLGAEARRLRDGTYSPDLADRFFEAYGRLMSGKMRQAVTWGVGLVLEGYALSFSDETALVRRLAEETFGERVNIARILLAPDLEHWNHNRLTRNYALPREVKPVTPERHQRAVRPLDEVPGVQDHRAECFDDVKPIADGLLQRYKWHQRFALGPVETVGPSDSMTKFALIRPEDIRGKRAVDLCCATGAIALLMKDAGAAEATGIEYNPRHFCKAREVRNTLHRAGVDAAVIFRLGDVRKVLPRLGRFDTAVMLGALHYFEDYAGMLRLIAHAVDGCAYIEFNFAEENYDSRGMPEGVHRYVRQSGNPIFIASRETVERLVPEAMAGFIVEERMPSPGPGRKHVFDREIWRLQRTT